MGTAGGKLSGWPLVRQRLTTCPLCDDESCDRVVNGWILYGAVVLVAVGCGAACIYVALAASGVL